jgi:ABC-type sugar transport system ATPase subunit
MSAPMSGAAASPGVEIRGLRKHYGDTHALAGLDIVADRGKILGIAGPNGAGKSTMIKILAGETPATAGEIIVEGQPWSPVIGARLVAVVHQEPQLFPNLTVGENLVIGRERSRWMRHGLNDHERELLADLAILDVADRTLASCPLAIQQRTEIARALAQDARVVLFDEPNSALTDEESEDLFRRMHVLADAGRTVVLVSHRLGELAEHADRVVVILDGRVNRVLEGDEIAPDVIARSLVTGSAERDAARARLGASTSEALLRVRGLSHRRGEFEGVDLDVAAGTIIALTGVEGSGARELSRAIAGFEHVAGQVEVLGHRGSVADLVAFVPASRNDSLFSNFTVGDNVVARLGGDRISGRAGVLRRAQMATLAQEMRERFNVKAATLDTPIRSLSGGNQQKVAIAAAVICEPRALVLEEPTRGVDIGSKAEIYAILRAFADESHAVVLYCTEIPEVFDVADLLYVVAEGRLAEPLRVAEFDDVESLAAAAAKLERHASRRGEAA